jgi:hypothetical protein
MRKILDVLNAADDLVSQFYKRQYGADVKKVGQNGDWNIPVDFDVNMSRLEWT